MLDRHGRRGWSQEDRSSGAMRTSRAERLLVDGTRNTVVGRPHVFSVDLQTRPGWRTQRPSSTNIQCSMSTSQPPSLCFNTAYTTTGGKGKGGGGGKPGEPPTTILDAQSHRALHPLFLCASGSGWRLC